MRGETVSTVNNTLGIVCDNVKGCKKTSRNKTAFIMNDDLSIGPEYCCPHHPNADKYKRYGCVIGRCTGVSKLAKEGT
jgi:hypothetical protein